MKTERIDLEKIQNATTKLQVSSPQKCICYKSKDKPQVLDWQLSSDCFKFKEDTLTYISGTYVWEVPASMDEPQCL